MNAAAVANMFLWNETADHMSLSNKICAILFSNFEI